MYTCNSEIKLHIVRDVVCSTHKPAIHIFLGYADEFLQRQFIMNGVVSGADDRN